MLVEGAVDLSTILRLVKRLHVCPGRCHGPKGMQHGPYFPCVTEEGGGEGSILFEVFTLSKLVILLHVDDWSPCLHLFVIRCEPRVPVYHWEVLVVKIGDDPVAHHIREWHPGNSSDTSQDRRGLVKGLSCPLHIKLHGLELVLWVLFCPDLLKGFLVFKIGDVIHSRQVMFKFHLDTLQVLVVKDKELQRLNGHRLPHRRACAQPYKHL